MSQNQPTISHLRSLNIPAHLEHLAHLAPRPELIWLKRRSLFVPQRWRKIAATGDVGVGLGGWRLGVGKVTFSGIIHTNSENQSTIQKHHTLLKHSQRQLQQVQLLQDDLHGEKPEHRSTLLCIRYSIMTSEGGLWSWIADRPRVHLLAGEVSSVRAEVVRDDRCGGTAVACCGYGNTAGNVFAVKDVDIAWYRSEHGSWAKSTEQHGWLTVYGSLVPSFWP